MSQDGAAGSGPDKLMVLIGLASMAFGSYLTLQRDDSKELRVLVGQNALAIARLESRVAYLERDQEREWEDRRRPDRP